MGGQIPPPLGRLERAKRAQFDIFGQCFISMCPILAETMLVAHGIPLRCSKYPNGFFQEKYWAHKFWGPYLGNWSLKSAFLGLGYSQKDPKV